MIIIENRFKHWIGILAAIFLGMTFFVAAISKLFTPAVEIELPAVLVALLGGLELTIGVLLVTGVYVKIVAGFSLFPIACFIISNVLVKILGGEECLSCFGAMGKLSATQALYLDGIMVALAIVILIYYPGRFFSVRPWYWGKNDGTKTI